MKQKFKSPNIDLNILNSILNPLQKQKAKDKWNESEKD